jgi:putative restriction endonuclease
MLTKYLRRLTKLCPDHNRTRWPATTGHQAPHKPLLLLSVMDQFARGQIRANLIEIIPDLGELFISYWDRLMQPEQRSTIALPFFHLKEKGSFWHLIPRPGKEDFLAEAYRNPAVAHTIRFSVNKLNDTILGARLDEELYALFISEDTRNVLRVILIKTYFEPGVQPILLEQGAINIYSFHYSQTLLTQALTKGVKKRPKSADDYPTAVRDQGFRRAVVTAYKHRCTICGIRILTLEGHTVVAAAHIIPWSVSHNDNPRNGMALCKVCHWCFDEGLVGISRQYVLILSDQLTVNRNIPGYILKLSSHGIIGPDEESFWPDPEALNWHHQHVFRKS